MHSDKLVNTGVEQAGGVAAMGSALVQLHVERCLEHQLARAVSCVERELALGHPPCLLDDVPYGDVLLALLSVTSAHSN